MVLNTPQYDPAMFAPGPSRDGRFEVKERWHECCNLPEGHPEQEVEFLHRQMNEEIDSVECAARMLTDFPDADWELQMCIARQCYDEARHVEMFRRIYERRGGRVGHYPVMNFQYRIITNVQDLYGRLAVQNRTFEAEGVDALQPEIEVARARNDHELAQLYDAQLADEIGHVRFANESIARAVAKDPSAVIRIGRALDYASRAFLQIMGPEAIERTRYSVNREGRLEAGFSPDEIRFAEIANAKRFSSAPDLERDA
jgi:uncharacterized ferritin-like protein (DUF455 family)